MAQTADVWRLYSRPDGVSSFELLKIDLGDGRSSPFASDRMQFAALAPHYETGWHNVPERTLVVTVDGSGEMETGDGQKIELKPGTIVLIEDTTGAGHRSSNGPNGRTTLLVPLDEGVSLK
jgi:mannose-6-phosphate isomerase-like protein (cupin superfamily)